MLPLTAELRAHVRAVGVRLLKGAADDHNSWSEICHCGFRPFSVLGAHAACQVWTHFVDCAFDRWHDARIHPGSNCFPIGGLSSRVLHDRVREFFEAFHATASVFERAWDITSCAAPVGTILAIPHIQEIVEEQDPEAG